MKNGTTVIFRNEDLAFRSGLKVHQVSIADLRKEALYAAEKADLAIFTDEVNFSVLKDRWGIGHIGLGQSIGG